MPVVAVLGDALHAVSPELVDGLELAGDCCKSFCEEDSLGGSIKTVASTEPVFPKCETKPTLTSACRPDRHAFGR